MCNSTDEHDLLYVTFVLDRFVGYNYYSIKVDLAVVVLSKELLLINVNGEHLSRI